MAIEHAMVALQEHWDDVIEMLGPERSRRLRDLIEGLGGADQARVVARMAGLLVEGLPSGHPVRRALTQGTLLVPGTMDLTALSTPLQALAAVWPDAGPAAGPDADLAAGPDPDLAAGPDPDLVAGPDADLTPDALLRSVAERLLRAPALGEDQVAGRGGDPADPDLIRLDRPDGAAQWPAFQFAPGGGPWPVVREINQILDAARYPLGAADWWLSRNGWLDEVPSELIGVADDRLVRAARAIRSEV